MFSWEDLDDMALLARIFRRLGFSVRYVSCCTTSYNGKYRIERTHVDRDLWDAS